MSQEASTRSVAESAQKMVNRLNQDVNLNESQMLSLESLAEEFALRCDSIERVDSLTFESRFAMKRIAYDAYKTTVENLLSSSQIRKLESKRAERNRTALLKQSKKK